MNLLQLDGSLERKQGSPSWPLVLVQIQENIIGEVVRVVKHGRGKGGSSRETCRTCRTCRTYTSLVEREKDLFVPDGAHSRAFGLGCKRAFFAFPFFSSFCTLQKRKQILMDFVTIQAG